MSNLIAMLPFTLVALAAVVRFFSAFSPRTGAYVGIVAGVYVIAVSFAGLIGDTVVSEKFILLDIDKISLSISFYADTYRLMMWCYALIVCGVIYLCAIGQAVTERIKSVYFSLIILVMCAISFVVLAGNMLTLILGWQMLTITVVLLSPAFATKQEKAVAARSLYTVLVTGDILFVVAAVYFAAKFGISSFMQLETNLALGIIEPRALFTGVLLFALAALIKAAQFPFFTSALFIQKSHSVVSAIVVGIVVPLGVYTLITAYPFIILFPGIQTMVVVSAFLTAFICSFLAVFSNSIMRIFIYAVLAQAATAVISLFSAGPALSSYIIANLFFSGVLTVLCAGVISACARTTNLLKLRKSIPQIPVLYFAMAVSAVSLLGLFPASGFFIYTSVLETSATKLHLIMFAAVYLLLGTAAVRTFISIFYVHVPGTVKKILPNKLSLLTSASLIALSCAVLLSGTLLANKRIFAIVTGTVIPPVTLKYVWLLLGLHALLLILFGVYFYRQPNHSKMLSVIKFSNNLALKISMVKIFNKLGSWFLLIAVPFNKFEKFFSIAVSYCYAVIKRVLSPFSKAEVLFSKITDALAKSVKRTGTDAYLLHNERLDYYILAALIGALIIISFSIF